MTIREETVKEKALPKGWREVRLGEVCTFQKGKGLSKKELKEDGKHACILYGELFTKYSGRIKNVISRTNDREEKFLSKKGDILMPSSDVTPKGLATASILYEDGIILGGDIIVIRCTRNQMDGLFFCFFVSANKHSVLKLTSGTTVFHIYKSDLAKLKILLPPLLEQKAIASLLEKWDTAIEKTEALIAAKQKQFEWLVTSLINKSGHKKAHPLSITSHSGFVSSEKREVRLGEVCTFQKEKALPKGWRKIKLGEIYNISAGSDFNPKEASLTKNEKYPYPIYSNALTNKGLYGHSMYSKYDEDSITITARGDIGTANHRKTKFVAVGRLLVLKNKIPVLNEFVCLYINHKIRFFKETTGVPQLTAPQASKYQVILPPLPEQKAIVSLLEKAEKEINLLRTLIKEYHEQKRGLMQRLLTSKWRLKI